MRDASYTFIKEAARLGFEDKDVLLALQDISTTRSLRSKEVRALQRLKLLISGRGWPTEKIRIFLFDPYQMEALGKPTASPQAVGPTAVLIPSDYYRGLGESSLLRAALRGAVEARSLGLPGVDIPSSLPLDALQKGIGEVIAERIFSAPKEMQTVEPSLYTFQKIAERAMGEAGLTKDDVERVSCSEAVLQIGTNLNKDLPDLEQFIRQSLEREKHSSFSPAL